MYPNSNIAKFFQTVADNSTTVALGLLIAAVNQVSADTTTASTSTSTVSMTTMPAHDNAWMAKNERIGSFALAFALLDLAFIACIFHCYLSPKARKANAEYDRLNENGPLFGNLTNNFRV